MSEFPEWIKYTLAGGLAWLGKSGLDYFRALIGARNETKKTDNSVSIDQRKMSIEEFEVIKKAFKEDFERFRTEIERLNNSIHDLIRDNERQKLSLERADERLMALEKEFREYKIKVPDLPLPAWIKSPEGIMIGLNNAYEEAFLSPKGFSRNDYVGYEDDKIWGNQVASTFKRNDQKAIKNNEGVYIEIDDDNDLLKPWTFYKYPKFVDGTLIGIAGIGLPRHIK